MRESLVGERFGKLSIICQMSESSSTGCRNWLCLCDCGKGIVASTRELNQGKYQDCGCEEKKVRILKNRKTAEDLTGRVFGELTVISRAKKINGKKAWVCKCSCGNETITYEYKLKSGEIKNCGFHSEKNHTLRQRDITGQVFGQLTVIEKSGKYDHNGSIIWRCLCSCGNVCFYTSDPLIRNRIVSCGCYRRSGIKLNQGLHRIEGTCVERLLRQKARIDSRTGVVGVTNTRQGKYRAYIGFKGKRYHLGTFETIDEAMEARKNGEKIHEDFLREYFQENPEQNNRFDEIDITNTGFKMQVNC